MGHMGHEDIEESKIVGAIFMSNTMTRRECFQKNLFGLPSPYQNFVKNIKEGMILFLFDNEERQLYGVFKASSNGGMNIVETAFRSSGSTYPAQVRFDIVWKCRPLREKEFRDAIKENYFTLIKFRFGLTYKQVVRLMELFDAKRNDRRFFNNCTKSTKPKLQLRPRTGTLEKGRSSLEFCPGALAMDKDIGSNLAEQHEKSSFGHSTVRSFDAPLVDTQRSLPRTIPLSVDQSNMLMPSNSLNISALEANSHARRSLEPTTSALESNLYNPRSLPPTVPCPIESQPHTKRFGARLSPLCSHYRQREDPYLGPELPSDTSRAQFAPYSETTRDYRAQPFGTKSYLSSYDYLPSTLSSSSGYITRDPLGGRDHTHSAVASCNSSLPGFSVASSKSNANRQQHFGFSCAQSYDHPTLEIYPSEHHLIRDGKVSTSPKLSQRNIPAYPEVPEKRGCLEPAFTRHAEDFPDYISLPDYYEDSHGGQRNHGINICALEESSDMEHSSPDRESECFSDTLTYLSDQLSKKHHAMAASTRTTGFDRHQRRSVFSRLSGNPSSAQEAGSTSSNQFANSLSQGRNQWIRKTSVTQKSIAEDVGEQSVGAEVQNERCSPALDELINALSQRRKEWSVSTITSEKSNADDDGEHLVSVQVLDEPSSVADLDMPSQEEIEEMAEPPFLNFKRKSEACSVDMDSGVKGGAIQKRRKLVRPNFGEDHAVGLGKMLENVQNSSQEANAAAGTVQSQEATGSIITAQSKIATSDAITDQSSANETSESNRNGLKDSKDRNEEVCGRKIEIDLNKPGCIDTVMMDEADNITLFDADVFKQQTKEPFEVDNNKSKCLADASTEKVSPHQHAIDSNGEKSNQAGEVSLSIYGKDGI